MVLQHIYMAAELHMVPSQSSSGLLSRTAEERVLGMLGSFELP